MMAAKKFPVVDFLEALLLIAAMAVLMLCDPFGIVGRAIEYLRLKFPVFVREPRLLIYAFVNIGSFLAKSIAIFLIIVLVAARRMGWRENLAFTKPASGSWRVLIIPVVVLAAVAKTYHAQDPLVQNLPIRLVFPDAMAIGTLIVTSSIVIVAPVTEEIIFRGYFFDIFKRSFGPFASLAGTSLLFALVHGPQQDFDLLGLSIIAAVGIMLGMARERAGSIVPPMILHALYNLVHISIGALYFFILGY